MKNKNFEQATRRSAIEIVSTLAEANPKMLQDQSETPRANFFPAIAIMMTQVEDTDDLQAWVDKPKEEVLARNDDSSVALEALERIAGSSGEKTIMSCSGSLI